MNNVMTTFWRFLNEHSVEIPIIQRDYAQGRLGKEELRKTFLKDLKQALDSCVPLKLDFVYGSMERGILNPLDGQQRLTTLWLLHWYLAYMAGAMDKEVKRVLAKFTYETRISSREFCGFLTAFDSLPPPGTGVVEHIQNQTWFRSTWKYDPTIQSMLRMLGGSTQGGKDGIAGVFSLCSEKDCIECRLSQCIAYEEYWKRLIGTDCPIIFYSLDIHGINQTDDLYIKMNARGKPLTSFENLKADLAGYIQNRAKSLPDNALPDNEMQTWKDLGKEDTGFAIKMDTDWMNIFWKNCSPDRVVDEIYFAFLNRFFFGEVCLEKTENGNWLVPSDRENANSSYKFLNDSRAESDYDLRIAYASLVPYKFRNGEISLGVLQHLKQTLDAFCDFMGACKHDKMRPNELIPKCEWDGEFKFFPEYTPDNDLLKDNAGNEVRKVTVLTQPQRIVFFAICKFFWELKMGADKTNINAALKRWLRVVRNLVFVQDPTGKLYIRTFSTMRSAMSVINDLDSQNVYEYLAKIEVKNKEDPTIFDLQFEEEIQKARKILGPMTTEVEKWEQKIIDAECSGFFKGAIRFLYTDKNGNVDWKDFDTKYENAKRYFDKKGVSDKFRANALLLRAFLARIGERNISEGFWFGNGAEFWRNQVLLNAEFNSVVSELLQSEITHDNAITEYTPAWIADEVLLSDAIKNDNVPNGQWHIITDWFREGNSDDKTLTRYTNRIKGNVTHPWQIIPLCEGSRNKLLDGLESKQRRGKCYFIGLKSDINFKFNDHWFRWLGTPNSDDGEYDIYLLKEEWKDDSSYAKHDKDTSEKGDKQEFFCFNVNTEVVNDFKTELQKLITAYTGLRP